MPETTNVSHDLTIRVPVRAIDDASRRAADAICGVVPADDLHEEYIGSVPSTRWLRQPGRPGNPAQDQ